MSGLRPQRQMLHEHEGRGYERDSCHGERTAPAIAPRYFNDSCSWQSSPVQSDPPHAYRTGDVLDHLVTTIFANIRQFVPNVSVNRTRNTNAARIGETLQAGGNVDAVTINLLALHHDVAQVDPDAELHPTRR